MWNAASAHFNDEQLASIVLWVAVTNMFNRVNADHPTARRRREGRMTTASSVAAVLKSRGEVFDAHRPHLRAVGYRMLGSVS